MKNKFNLYKTISDTGRRICAVLGICALADTNVTANEIVKSNQEFVAVTVTHVHHNQWALGMVKAISGGNIEVVDSLLAENKVCIDDVISTRDCTTELPWTLWSQDHSIDERCRPYRFTDVASQMSHFLNEAAMNDIRYTSHSYHTPRRLPAANYEYAIYGTPLMIAVRMRNTYMVKELLRRGANPNVFIRCLAVNFSRAGDRSDSTAYSSALPRRQMPETDGSLDDYLLPRLCALTDLYGTGSPQTLKTDDAIAELLVKAGASFKEGEKDGRGRTAMWEVAAVRSTFLLGVLCSNGWDVNHKDNVGKTVADYCTAKLATLPQGEDRDMLIRFVRELGRLGGRIPSSMPGANSTETIRPLQLPTSGPGGSTGSFVPSQPPLRLDTLPVREDHSVERAQIQGRIDSLRVELIEAERNHHNAIVQGTGSIIAGMAVSQIKQEISDLTMELKRLQDR